jgi:hypothetical protein
VERRPEDPAVVHNRLPILAAPVRCAHAFKRSFTTPPLSGPVISAARYLGMPSLPIIYSSFFIRKSGTPTPPLSSTTSSIAS